MFPYVALMVGCHFTREEAVKLQKGLKFMFLESHILGRYMDISMYNIYEYIDHLNLFEVMEVE